MHLLCTPSDSWVCGKRALVNTEVSENHPITYIHQTRVNEAFMNTEGDCFVVWSLLYLSSY